MQKLIGGGRPAELKKASIKASSTRDAEASKGESGDAFVKSDKQD